MFLLLKNPETRTSRLARSMNSSSSRGAGIGADLLGAGGKRDEKANKVLRDKASAPTFSFPVLEAESSFKEA